MKKASAYWVISIVVAATLLGWLIWKKSSHADLVVGVIVAETGPPDFIGKPEAAVLRALENQLSRQASVEAPFRLQFEDSGGVTNRAVSLFQQFAANKSVVAVIGPSTSGESIAVADEAEKAGVPLLSLAASKDIVIRPDGTIRSYVFKFAQNDDLAALRLVAAMKAEGDSRIALLYSNDGFGKSGANVVRQAIGDAAGLILAYDGSFEPALDRPEAAAAGIDPNVDGIVIWGTSPGPALLVKALAQRNHPAQIYLSHGNASASFIADAGAAAEGAIIVGSRILRPQFDSTNPSDQVLISFRDLWEQASIPGEVSHFGGHARDAYGMLIDAFSRGAKTRADVRTNLESTPSFEGVTGTFSFSANDHAGLTARAFETYVIRSGEFAVWQAP